jgi:hypothetical protein
LNTTEETAKQSFKDILRTFLQKLEHQGGSRNIRVPNAIIEVCPDWQRAVELEKTTHIPPMLKITVVRQDGCSTLNIELERR